MCDFFSWQMQRKLMESHNQGDLTDIVRSTLASTSDKETIVDGSGWQFSTDDSDLLFSQLTSSSTKEEFGDPFANSTDPLLLHELPTSHFIDVTSSGQTQPMSLRQKASISSTSSSSTAVLGEGIKRPATNLFSRMLQISPPAAAAAAGVLLKPLPFSPRAIRPSPPIIGGTASCSSTSIDNAMGISTSRSTGMKRRKSQAKKVVCVPAPAAASNRPTGEVVPSDLWAWRKYGQKPIKGSPYPRGYYRCSSSKGCSARKQVERSRNDPNMLVITYTSEHNHPWPTQRNALAGSTRSLQFPKNNNNSSSSSLARSNSQRPASTPANSNKDEVKDQTRVVAPSVKEEAREMAEEKAMEASTSTADEERVCHQSYRPMIPDASHSDDFFADLAELESDPINLIFSSGSDDHHQKLDVGEAMRDSKDLDHIFFDWSSGNTFGSGSKQG